MNTSHSQQQSQAQSQAGGAPSFNNIAPRTREERVWTINTYIFYRLHKRTVKRSKLQDLRLVWEAL